MCVRTSYEQYIYSLALDFSLGYRGKDVPGEVRTLEINPANPKQVSIDHYIRTYVCTYIFYAASVSHGIISVVADWVCAQLSGTLGCSDVEAYCLLWDV